jgi:uncharacterized protein YbjT (DUF2867 family)
VNKGSVLSRLLSTVQTRSALLLGASGLIGGHLLGLLVADMTYDRVIVPVRKSLSYRHPKLQEVVVDFDHLDKQKDSLRGQDVFCCLGTTIKAAKSQPAFRKVDFTYVEQTASIAAMNGAEQFLLVSSLGADKNSSAFYLRVKGEVEEAIARLPFKAAQIFRPSVLIGVRGQSRFNESFAIMMMKLVSVVLLGRLRRYRAIEAKTVAQAMLTVAKQQNVGVAVYESERIQILGHA